MQKFQVNPSLMCLMNFKPFSTKLPAAADCWLCTLSVTATGCFTALPVVGMFHPVTFVTHPLTHPLPLSLHLSFLSADICLLKFNFHHFPASWPPRPPPHSVRKGQTCLRWRSARRRSSHRRRPSVFVSSQVWPLPLRGICLRLLRLLFFFF